jgi:hypothetical protein
VVPSALEALTFWTEYSTDGPHVRFGSHRALRGCVRVAYRILEHYINIAVSFSSVLGINGQ